MPAPGESAPASLGIEIAPLAQLEGLMAQTQAGEGKVGKEVAGRVEVGKVAEKVVRNVSIPRYGGAGESAKRVAVRGQRPRIKGEQGVGSPRVLRRKYRGRCACRTDSVALQLPAFFRRTASDVSVNPSSVGLSQMLPDV